MLCSYRLDSLIEISIIMHAEFFSEKILSYLNISINHKFTIETEFDMMTCPFDFAYQHFGLIYLFSSIFISNNNHTQKDEEEAIDRYVF